MSRAPLFAVAAVLLALSPCSVLGEPGPSIAVPHTASEPPNEAPTGPPPPAEFDASLTVDGDALRISYRLVNENDGDLWVLNRVPVAVTPTRVTTEPDAVYVTGRGDHTVEIAKRAFDMPPGVGVEVPAEIGATLLPPGQAVAEQLTVALPLRRYHPYGDDVEDGLVLLPDPVESVLFCVGVVADTPYPPYPSSEGWPAFPHLVSTTRYQHLFCSAALLLS
jgi:hypothetical protein